MVMRKKHGADNKKYDEIECEWSMIMMMIFSTSFATRNVITTCYISLGSVMTLCEEAVKIIRSMSFLSSPHSNSSL